MPIQIESVQTASGNSATANFTVAAAGENRAIAALVGLYSPLGEEVTSATYANQALTRQALVESSDGDHSEIWTRLDPPAGSNTLALNFTFPGNPRGWVVGGVALSGVESIRGAATANGDSGPANPSLSIATQPGDVVLSVVTFYDAAINPASGATELFDLVDPTEDTYCAGSALTASGASTTVAWAFSGTPAENWALAATAVAPADDEGGGEPTTIDLTAASVGIAGSAIRSRLATALTAPAVAFAAQPTRQSLAVGFVAPGIVVAPQSAQSRSVAALTAPTVALAPQRVRPRSVASLTASALALALRPAVGSTTGGVNAAAFEVAGRPLDAGSTGGETTIPAPFALGGKALRLASRIALAAGVFGVVGRALELIPSIETMGVEEHLFQRLANFAGLRALVVDRIYHGTAPQRTAEPYVVYQQITAQRVSVMGADTGLVHMRFQFDAWARSRDHARAVAREVRRALQRYRGTIGGHTIQDVFVVSEFSDYEEQTRLHRYSQDFMVHHLE